MSRGRTSQIVHREARYLASKDLEMAVEVALATERPLLLFGNPGSGKSSVAWWAAQKYGRRYYEHTVTARTQSQDLLWSFDSIRRLSDATTPGKDLNSNGKYVKPGVLWWAFDQSMATGIATSEPEIATSEPDCGWNSSRQQQPAVVLIDEIDKADPDLPNSLLVPLGSRKFTVSDLDKDNVVEEREGARSLIILTTNEERELPQPFIRRCVVFTLLDHDKSRLKEIAELHFNLKSDELSMVDDLAGKLIEHRKIATDEGRRAPSTAEFIDAVRACLKHEYHRDDTRLKKVLDMLYVKQPNRQPGG